MTEDSQQDINEKMSGLTGSNSKQLYENKASPRTHVPSIALTPTKQLSLRTHGG
jgi:hypothetical protein